MDQAHPAALERAAEMDREDVDRTAVAGAATAVATPSLPLIPSAASPVERARARLDTLQCWLRSERAALFGLAAAGGLLELSLVLGWLRAFPLLGNPGFPQLGQDALIWRLGDGAPAINRFLVLLAIVFVPYLLALALAARVPGRAGIVLALAGSVLLGTTLLLAFPAGATDIFHNVMDGRLVWLYHLNPMLVPPSAVSNDPLFGYLHYWQNWSSSYGPLWFLLTAPAVLAGGNGLTSNIIAFKALPFALELICVVLIALIAHRIRPGSVAAAVICFGWNPLVLWETAGNGHNDVAMMVFALLAVLLLLTPRWQLAIPALAFSVLVKFVSLLLLPIIVIWLLRRRGRAAVIPIIIGLLWALLIVAIIFFPFWQGPETLHQFRRQQYQLLFSPASAIIGTWGEDLPNTSGVLHVKYALTACFAILYGLALLRIGRDPATLVRACAEAMFLLLVLMTWWFWPWYVIWGLAFAAILVGSVHARVFIIFSMTAMLLYVSSAWRLTLWNFDSPYPLALGTALIIFLPPVLYVLLQVLPGGRAEPAAAAARAERIESEVR